VQADILHGRPDDGHATGLRGEHVDLISALAHITEETLNRIGGLNVSMHPLSSTLYISNLITDDQRDPLKRRAGY
jgi:hypothetical protein